MAGARALMTIAALAAAITAASVGQGRASAHPLGNFTVNRYSAIDVSPSGISILFVVDMAEVPAFQEVRAMDANSDGTPDSAEQAAYVGKTAAALIENLRLTLNGRPARVEQRASRISFPAGQGGLDTLRIELELAVPLPRSMGGPVELTYTDANFAGRLGWHEIIVRPLDGVALSGSSVPAEDITNALRSYPQDRLRSPVVRDSASARFHFTGAPAPGESQAKPAITAPTVPVESPGRGLNGLERIIAADDIGPGLIVLALVIAAGIGAVHALTPGHGKTLMAAYLAAANGTSRHALMLGATVAVSHTAGVLALGAVILFASETITPEAVYPYLGLIAGGIVLVIGLRMLASRVRLPGRGSGASKLHDSPATVGPLHDHGHGQGAASHSHSHDGAESGPHDGHHSHEHGHGHTHHTPPPGAGVTWRSLLAIGLADGLVPSASALLIWLAAIGLGRATFGLALVGAFGVGMAGVLVGTGLLLVYGRGLFERRIAPRFQPAHRLNAAVPLITALFVAGAGLTLILRAFRQFGTI